MAKRKGNRLELGPTEQRIIREQQEAFKKKFGREMGEHDPLFF
jgi:hypothetical protein